ncbi:POT family proton-dependent oligopeptide transporter [Sphingomonas sp. BE270]|jgi:POT family proton-dependent oligopeptide transporter|uniref:peptide MFS transporter n=1 Tax=unclassified Sphingomonas TaxID=196159 RepID=UPI0020169059|nr:MULTISPECIES: peptide MFS transporter [unclassified Sphingomonas]MDR7258558.1 POT family proton-dependent oligopeptide transporter [Sphingomonas sp. BE270]
MTSVGNRPATDDTSRFGVSETPTDARTVLGHPRGLFVLFFAEMWERFSYYGMRAILIFYLTKHFLFAKDHSYAVYGTYTSLVYITPVIGGYLADRFLGARKAVLAGGVFIVTGHLLIALLEGPAGAQGLYLNGFYLGLAAIVVGTGFLKANVSVLVGELYARGDRRRDGAFSIFYMGINLGAWVGPILIGILGETVGWSYGFGAAGIGMLIGLVAFVVFQKDLRGAGRPPGALRGAPVFAGLSLEPLIYLGGIGAVGVVWWLIRSQGAVGILLIGFAVLTVGYIVWRSVYTLPRVERDRVFAALFLVALSPLFWALFEQAGSSLNVFTDERVDRMLFGYQIPAAVFQSINSAFIIVLAPLFGWGWAMLARRRLEPNVPLKFGIGLILVGLGFLVLVAGAAPRGALTPALFIVLVYLFHAMGELCFSPIGLSSMTRLSVTRMTGLMMGTWFLSTAAGNFIAALIAQTTGAASAGPDTILNVYTRIGGFSIVVGLGVAALSPLVVRLMHLDTIADTSNVADTVAV